MKFIEVFCVSRAIIRQSFRKELFTEKIEFLGNLLDFHQFSIYDWSNVNFPERHS